MKAIVAIFFNHRQRRLRALWRILVFVVDWALITIALVGVARLILPHAVTESDDGFRVEALCAFAGVLLLLCLAGRVLDRRRLADFGLKLDGSWWLDFVFGLLLGGIAISVTVLVSLAAGWARVTDTLVSSGTFLGGGFAWNLAIIALVILLAAAQEELFFRGYLLTNMAEGFSFPRGGRRRAVLAAVLLSSGVFGVVHMTNPHANIVGTSGAALMGLIMACGYVWTGRLALPIGLHATWNLFQCSVFGTAVSGLDLGSPTFLLIERDGPELWVGGAYGPESGLLLNFAAVLTVPLILLWVRLRNRGVRLHPRLADPAGPVRSIETCPQR